MSFNFSVPTNALFGVGKLGELHTQINTPMGAVHGRKALVVISNGTNEDCVTIYQESYK